MSPPPSMGVPIRSAQIWALALLAAVSPLATGMYLPAMPLMGADLPASTTGLQLTVTAFLAGLAAGQLIIGAVSDRTGRRGPLLIAGVACVVASGACAAAPTIEVLVLARFVQGFAGAAGIVLGRAIVADRTRGAESARVFSILMTIGAVAPVLAPIVGGAVMQISGWRAIFWVLTLIAILMLVASFLALPESLPAARRAGSWQTTLREAVLVLANRHYLGYTLTLVFSYATLIAYVAASPFVLQVGAGVTPVWYSVVFAVNALGLTLGSLINARLVLRISARRLLAMGLALQLTAVATLSLLAVAGRLPLPALLLLLWVSVSSLGFIAANATSLALEDMTQGVGSASAILGAAQFGVAALVAPLVGLAGGSSATPMAFVMVLGAALALTSFLVLTRSHTPQESKADLP